MIVVEPVAVNDGNFTSSTIAEPDISQGEVEWVANKGDVNITQNITSICNDGVNFWGLEYTGVGTATIYRYTIEFIYDSFSFNITQGFSAVSITSDGTYIYVLSRGGPSTNIFKYTLAGVYTGVSWVTPTTPGIAGVICWDGVNINLTYITTPALSRTITQWDTIGNPIASTEVTGVVGAVIVGMSFDGLYYYIADSTTEKILKLNPDFSYTGENWDYTAQTDDVNGFVFASKKFYISNNADNKIHSYDSDLVSTNYYKTGEQSTLAVEHLQYQSSVANGDSPEIGAAKTPPTWVKVGPTNKYAPFDGAIRTQSIASNSIIEEITPGRVIGGLAVINMTSVSSIQIEMTDPVDGIVYDRTVTTENNSEINNWFNYLWTGFDFKTEFVVLDLPPYINATTKITLTGNGEIGVGAVVLGPIFRLGVSNHGTNVRQLDFNLYSEDQFGNLDVTPRPYAKLVNFKNTVDRGLLPYVYGKLEQLRGVNAVWVGDETDENDLTLVYGPHRDNTLNIDSPTACTVPIQIRGLT